ncbi:hypothetical protein D3C81_2200270 [compost metagenome]
MIEPYPNPFQTSVNTSIGLNQWLLAINKTGSSPNQPNTALTGPSYEKMFITTVANTAQERKLGK